MQLVKLSKDTWMEPEQAPAEVCPVNVASFIAVENVTEMVDDASGMAPSVGVVLTTVGAAGVTHTPLPSHSVPPVVQGVPAVNGGCDGTPAVQTSPVHSLASVGMSMSWLALTSLPLPSHTFCLQSPGT